MLRTILLLLALAYSRIGLADCAQADSVAFLRATGVELSVPMTAEQLERENMIPVVTGGQTIVLPFGYSNKEWMALKAKWQPGDYFVRYQSNAALARKNKLYVDGHLLVRNGCAIGFMPGAIS